MAKILYGVHGTGHGHAIRALSVARHFQQHEFLFVSHSHGAALLTPEYPVFNCPNPVTPVRRHQVATADMLSENARFFFQHKRLMNSVVKIVADFQPDAAVSDYEFFVPRACRIARIPCLSLDHQHIVPFASHRLPLRQLGSFITTSLLIKYLFSSASAFMVTSFFRPPIIRHARAVVLPPLLRESVLDHEPSRKRHVLAYHGYPTSGQFYDLLRKLTRPVIAYGLNVHRKEGPIVFKKNSEHQFLSDLASCRYVICGGGHSLISEALYFGKPLIVVPIKHAFEQFLNAYYVERLGYGLSFETFDAALDAIPGFERALDRYCSNINQDNFCGNSQIFERLNRFFNNGEKPFSQ